VLKALKGRLRPLASSLIFERRLGVETSRIVEPEELGYTDERLIRYEPAEWRTLQRALSKQSVGAEDVFVDLGSGMGRMVLRAARYPFKRVIGVELSPQLHAIANENLERNRGSLRCQDVQLVRSDAVAYQLPDDVTVVFLNNPFTGEVFQSVVGDVIRSIDRRPRRLRIIYRNPVEHERLMRTGRVRVAGEWQKGAWRGRRRGVVIRWYDVLPKGEREAAATSA
jgi:SAM-dependent methyltransferase